ncbi:MAG TPA: PhnD/SsuA/transferrin family substrate-binding protein [Azoarcus taiwanensis]|nr:PhnD/SsuA/transferrin family substrate-binding protein [Azoarcus taiwanensis]
MTPPLDACRTLQRFAGIIALLMLLSGLSGPVRASLPDERKIPLIVGVLAHRSVAEVEARWQPLATHLQSVLGGIPVRVVAMSYEQLNEQVSRQGVDLVLTNPSHYIELRRRNPLSGALLTLVPEGDGLALSSFGGTIVVRADRDDLRTLADLVGRRIAAVSETSLGGYQAQAATLAEHGIPAPTNVTFLGMPHDHVVEALIAGDYDVGFVRSGLVESLIAEGRLEPSSLRVINQQELPGFPHAVSTRLYPEWPLFATPHVSPELVRRVAAALLQLEPDSDTTRAIGIHGFSIPADYQAVEDLLRRLRLPPFDAVPEVTWSDLWVHHSNWLIAIASSMLLLLAATSRIFMMGRRTQRANHRFDQLFKTVPTPILLIEDGVFTDCNAAAVHALGFSDRSELIGKSPYELSPAQQADGEDSAIKAKRILDKVLEGEPTRLDWIHLHTDGSERTIEVSLSPLDTSSERHILCAWHDITERDRSHRLVASELALFSSGPVIVFEWAPPTDDWPITSVSNNVTVELGYTPEEMAEPGFKFAALMHPDDVERIRLDSQTAIMHGKTTWEQSYRLRRKSGEYAWYYDFTQAVRDTDGRLLALRGYLIDQTTTKQLELQLDEERKSLLNILWGTGVGTWEWNVQTGETRFNDRWAQIIGYTLDELDPVSIDTWLAHLHPDDHAVSEAALQRNFSGLDDHYECEVRMRHRSGHWVWVLDRGKVVDWTDDGRPLWMAGTHLEITARKRAQEQQLTLIHVLSDAGIMLMVVDREQTVRYMNRTMSDRFGNQVGRSSAGLIGDADPACTHDDLVQVIDGKSKAHYRTTTHDAQILDVIAVPYTDTDGTPCRLEVIRDVTLEYRQQKTLEHIAYHDPLTGLANRPLLSDRMKQAMLDARRRDLVMAIAYIDLDGFKEVNDLHGHQCGDALLAALAQRMRGSLRESDTVARLGGDEFAVVLRDLSTPEAAQPMIQRLLEDIAKPATILGHEVQVSASIGISFFTSGADVDPDLLLREADQAMYEAKSSGKNRVSVFHKHSPTTPDSPG